MVSYIYNLTSDLMSVFHPSVFTTPTTNPPSCAHNPIVPALASAPAAEQALARSARRFLHSRDRLRVRHDCDGGGRRAHRQRLRKLELRHYVLQLNLLSVTELGAGLAASSLPKVRLFFTLRGKRVARE